MLIRGYKPSDCKDIAELYYKTIHSINAIDLKFNVIQNNNNYISLDN